MKFCRKGNLTIKSKKRTVEKSRFIAYLRLRAFDVMVAQDDYLLSK
ncbi:MAG: hypothetical protein IPK14_04245 [Blastocatellia bacterium]|nr:hypothetical protein [Blastocatellia bacterium]MBL8195330.1 hypothetical protein [Blastocatellia bacterium]MBN8725625.1 hypothetical protein [Acidobacteriota bacterium]